MLDFTHQERRVLWVLLFSALLGAGVLAFQELAGATRWETLLEEEFAPATAGTSSPAMVGAALEKPAYRGAALLPHLPEGIPPGDWLTASGALNLPFAFPAATGRSLNNSQAPKESGEQDASIPVPELRPNHLPYRRVGKPRLAGLPININRASASQLQMLPGIGPKLAEQIIKLRTERGGFARLEELLDVSGIGQKKFEKIKDLITP